MRLMEKDGKYEYVADAHFDCFIKKGYAVADGVPPKPEDELSALKEENKALKAELEAYKEQVFKMLTPVEGSDAPAVETSHEEAPEAEENPKKSKKDKTE